MNRYIEKVIAEKMQQTTPIMKLLSNRGWRWSNQDKVKAGRRRYYLANRERLLKKSKQWKAEDKDRQCLRAIAEITQDREMAKMILEIVREHILSTLRG